MTVACVYRTGGDYDARYVQKLLMGVRQNLSLPHRFVCLTDAAGEELDFLRDLPNMSILPLAYDWPGWWSKIELFCLEPPVLSLDLDTRVVGSIDPLGDWAMEKGEGFLMLRGFYRSDACSGVMSWRMDMSWVMWTFADDFALQGTFERNSLGVSMRCRRGAFRGDQEWIRSTVPPRRGKLPGIVFAQDVMDGIYSYKVHIQGKATPPSPRLIIFHGRPRPHEVEDAPEILGVRA